ncbi:MAG: hypothetical protein RLZZ618_2806 [Pseudomonadota bacterium]|jgi:hypothetical protein
MSSPSSPGWIDTLRRAGVSEPRPLNLMVALAVLLACAVSGAVLDWSQAGMVVDILVDSGNAMTESQTDALIRGGQSEALSGLAIQLALITCMVFRKAWGRYLWLVAMGFGGLGSVLSLIMLFGTGSPLGTVRLMLMVVYLWCTVVLFTSTIGNWFSSAPVLPSATPSASPAPVPTMPVSVVIAFVLMMCSAIGTAVALTFYLPELMPTLMPAGMEDSKDVQAMVSVMPWLGVGAVLVAFWLVKAIAQGSNEARWIVLWLAFVDLISVLPLLGVPDGQPHAMPWMMVAVHLSLLVVPVLLFVPGSSEWMRVRRATPSI